MAQITYTGDGTVEWFGLQFAPNKAVNIDDSGLQPAQKLAILGKAATNPFFDVSGETAGAEPDDDSETFGAYTVKHKGRGKYAVLKGDDTVADGLTKEEAETHAADLKSADEAARA